MISLVQILTLLFVVFSFVLLIAIPVLFINNKEAEQPQGTVYKLATFWTSLLIVTTFANSLL